MSEEPKNNPFYELFKKEVEKHFDKVFTKETLRKSLGYEISQSTFNRILNCDGVYQTLDANFVAAYAKYFNVTADYLLGIRKTSIVNEDVAMIEKSTGLSESAINVLRTEMNIGHKRLIEALNLLICDMYYLAEGRRYRPFVELFANYLNFQDDNKMYALNQRGNMKEAQPQAIDNGVVFWDSKNLYITKKQKEELFLMEMENILKILKEEYNKNPNFLN